MVATKGFIRKLSDLEGRTGIIGHPDLTAFRFVRPGEDGSLHIGLTLDVIEPGGGIDPHYHTDCAMFDHVYYVISGEIEAKLGDEAEETIGPDSIIYCPSNVTHSIRNVGKEESKVLRIGAAASGDMLGTLIYLSGESWKPEET
jgi:mannose-6-phosphate isomerase-like protein (cupin superfamily)